MSRDVQHYYAGRKYGAEEVVIHFIIDYDKKEAFISLWTPEELSSPPESGFTTITKIDKVPSFPLSGRDSSDGGKGDDQ